MDKIERKIEKSCKKSQKLVNFRDEVLKDIQSYNNRCNSQGKSCVLVLIWIYKSLNFWLLNLERKSVEKIEKLQHNIFKTLSEGFQSILDEENQMLLDDERWGRLSCIQCNTLDMDKL